MGQLVLRFECKAQTPWGIASKAELRPFCPFLFPFVCRCVRLVSLLFLSISMLLLTKKRKHGRKQGLK